MILGVPILKHFRVELCLGMSELPLHMIALVLNEIFFFYLFVDAVYKGTNQIV